MSKELEALEKIDHTVCLAFNENNNALFNKDQYEHIDCKDIYEFVECYDIIEKGLKALELTKRINFDIVYREQFDEWTLFVVITTQDGEYLEPVAFGSGKEEYELLKEVLL